MKSWKQVILFASLKKKLQGENDWQNKSAFYFLWYSEIRVEIYYKPLKIKEAVSSLSVTSLIGILLGLTGALSELFL